MRKSIFTRYIINIKSGQRNFAINMILENNLKFIKSYVNSEHSLVIIIKKYDKKKYECLFKKYNIDAEILEHIGYLHFLELLKSRAGIFFGLAALLISMYYSSNVVWKINVSGNSKLTEEQILKELDNVGFNLGTYIPSIDYDVLHNRVLLNSENLAWISVNIKGNVANVIVKERYEEKNKQDLLYSNVVAKSDGHIASIVVKNGKKEISIGDVVRKGDILISGVINSQSQGVRYEQASGEVKAYVNKEINIKIPFKSEKKVYTGEISKNKTYYLYNFPLKFLTKYRNYSGCYDTIVKKEKLCLMGISSIPFTTVSTTYYGYEMVEVIYTVSEASDVAFAELRKQMDELLKNSELLSKDVQYSYDSEYFYVNCQLYCLEDIATTQEFFLTE